MECITHTDHDEYHARGIDDDHPIVTARCGTEFDDREAQVTVHESIARAKRTGKDPCQDCLDKLKGPAADNFAR